MLMMSVVSGSTPKKRQSRSINNLMITSSTQPSMISVNAAFNSSKNAQIQLSAMKPQTFLVRNHLDKLKLEIPIATALASKTANLKMS